MKKNIKKKIKKQPKKQRKSGINVNINIDLKKQRRINRRSIQPKSQSISYIPWTATQYNPNILSDIREGVKSDLANVQKQTEITQKQFYDMITNLSNRDNQLNNITTSSNALSVIPKKYNLNDSKQPLIEEIQDEPVLPFSESLFIDYQPSTTGQTQTKKKSPKIIFPKDTTNVDISKLTKNELAKYLLKLDPNNIYATDPNIKIRSKNKDEITLRSEIKRVKNKLNMEDLQPIENIETYKTNEIFTYDNPLFKQINERINQQQKQITEQEKQISKDYPKFNFI